MTEEDHADKLPSLADFYPNLRPEELRAAEENLDRYLELALRIFSRIKADPQEYARFKALTDKELQSTINDKGRPLHDLQNQ